MAGITVTAVLQQAKQALKNVGIESFALDAEILLRHALKISREELIKDPDRVVEVAPLLYFHGLLSKRLAHEPIAYILGEKEFYGRDFKVTAATLVPRPDSEVLVEAVLKYAPKTTAPMRILDLGTGSGCLLLTLLAEIKGLSGIGIDISEAAITVAKANAEKLGLAKQVEFRINDWRDEEIGEAFDIIISNPPYIKQGEIPGLHPSVFLYEPHRALNGGQDGLTCYRELAGMLRRWLKPGGMIFLECGLGQHQEVTDIFNQQGFNLVSLEKDLAGIHRCIVLH